MTALRSASGQKARFMRAGWGPRQTKRHRADCSSSIVQLITNYIFSYHLNVAISTLNTRHSRDKDSLFLLSIHGQPICMSTRNVRFAPNKRQCRHLGQGSGWTKAMYGRLWPAEWHRRWTGRPVRASIRQRLPYEPPLFAHHILATGSGCHHGHARSQAPRSRSGFSRHKEVAAG